LQKDLTVKLKKRGGIIFSYAGTI